MMPSYQLTSMGIMSPIEKLRSLVLQYAYENIEGIEWCNCQVANN